ncbi:unnamed protein product [Prunus armeniaca]|uniref:Uncharacterized protein n=1 Tax=Prunus armeniaca TaxID=36596 RepID=A0A6J5VJH7_PRUAR|nr:unnamed protein product [Prunus armeniaca]
MVLKLVRAHQCFRSQVFLGSQAPFVVPRRFDPCDATDDAKISDGPQLFVRGDSLLPHSDVDDISGGLLVSEGAFVPPETPQPLNDVMDQKGEGSVVIEVGLAGIHQCIPSIAHMGLLSDAPPDQWAKEVAEILVQSLVSVYGDSFKIEALGFFAPFVYVYGDYFPVVVGLGGGWGGVWVLGSWGLGWRVVVGWVWVESGCGMGLRVGA